MGRSTRCSLGCVGLAILALLLGAEGQLHAGIVYIGLDPTSNFHSTQAQAGPLVGNAVRFVGGSSDPRIGLFQEAAGGGFFAQTRPLQVLQAQGFTHITVLTPAQLPTLDFSQFDVLYFAPTTVTAQVAAYQASAAQIASYALAGGGLVVEPEVFAPGSWDWVPFAGQIGHSGPINVGDDQVTIVDLTHPVMQGLTSAGLSNWDFSTHSDFLTPGAAGFTTLAVDGRGRAAVIALEIGIIPEPATLTLAGIGSLSLVGYGWRRRKQAAQA